MARDRRILLVSALLLAAVAALAALSSAWRERAEPKRAAPLALDGTASDPFAGAAPESGAPAAGEAQSAESLAQVRGVVTGTMGVLWGARVVAYRGEGGAVMAEAWTNPKGLYALPVEPGVEFDLAVEPAQETYLVSMRCRGLVLNAGDDREENFALGATAVIRGKLIDEGGNGQGGIEILAVRPEDMSTDPSAHPSAVLGREVGRCRTWADGGFRLGCLVGGKYAIVIRDPEWTLNAPTAIATDGPEATLTVVPAISVDLLVLNIETEESVDAFSAKLSIANRQGGGEPAERRVALEEPGSDGLFSRRLPGQPRPRFPLFIELDVTAKGFVPWGPGGMTSRTRQTVWLLPVRERNTTIRVFFDDGQPYRGRVGVEFEAKSGRSGGATPFERVDDGTYRGAMPRGQWTLHVRPETVFGYPRLKVDADVKVGMEAEVKLVLPAGGTLVLRPPSGDGPYCASLRRADEDDRPREECVYEVPAEGARIEGIPAGPYEIGCRNLAALVRALRDNAPADLHEPDIVWFRDVRVEVGSTEEIVLPAQ